MKYFINRYLKFRKVVMYIIDQILVLVSMFLALEFRYDFNIPLKVLIIFYNCIPFLLLSASSIYIIIGFYNQIWHFASIKQYLILFGGTLIQTIVFGLTMRLLNDGFSWSVYVNYLILSFSLITEFRVLKRVIYHFIERKCLKQRKENIQDHIRVMIIGAGQAGNQIIREMNLHTNNYHPVVVIDDNPETHGLRILGIPVYGGRSKILEAVQKYNVDLIIIAIPSASRKIIREIVEITNKTDCEIKSIPSLQELIDGKFTISDIKKVEIENLLGREEVSIDTESVANYIKNEVILVTGGGGSIGSELCRQIAHYQPRKLIILDIYENNAYQLQNELQAIYGSKLDLIVLIGSVRDFNRIDDIFSVFKPTVVFHAAAHKHVPLMENSPGEAVKNNIFGTYNVAMISKKHNVKQFVLISTDKAVNPTNVMGATKRIAEMIIQRMSSQKGCRTRFAAVRFGNVLGSNGSVIPLFKQQMHNERKVKITHPEIKRFFMTIPEAARLVIQAGAIAQGGEIFVLDMGEPVKIIDLANDLIRLSGLEPGVDVQIEFTGLRPGEKMYEELFLDKEIMYKTRHDKIFYLKPIGDVKELSIEISHLNKIIRWESEELDWLTDQIVQMHYSENAYTKESEVIAYAQK